MTVQTVVSAFVGFLEKHVVDLNTVAGALTELVSIAPLDAQDKTRISDTIATVKQSADNITSFLQNNTVTDPTTGEVTVKESDIVNAIANFFASDLGKSVLTDAIKAVESAAGNVPTPPATDQAHG